jgi:TRAP-type C4-dicarboxylate transport system permease small subunit
MAGQFRPRSWLIVYVVAILLFSFIMLWFATSMNTNNTNWAIPANNTSGKIAIVEGISDSKLKQHKFLISP